LSIACCQQTHYLATGLDADLQMESSFMQKPLFNTAALAAVILLSGCAGPPKPVIQEAPQTVVDPFGGMTGRVMDSGGIAAIGVGKSKSLELARNRAIANGRLNLQKTLDEKMRTLQRKFYEESGIAQNTQQLSAFRTATLSIKKQIQKSPPKEVNHEMIDGAVTACALIEFNPGIILQQLGKHEELYAQFRTTETYKELARAIESYKPLEETPTLTPAEQ